MYQSGAFLIFFVTSLIVILYASGYTYQPGENEFTKLGIVDFPFRFPGGILWIDGKQTADKFPQTLKLEPGWHHLRITHEYFQPWEKKIFLTEEKVQLFEELYFAPKKWDDGLFFLRQKVQRYEMIHEALGEFALFDKDLLVAYLFDLSKKRDQIWYATLNVPFRGAEKSLEIFSSPGVNISFEREKPIGKSSQKLVIRKGFLFLEDFNGENQHRLLPAEGNFLESSPDALTFAVISQSELKIFSPRAWIDDARGRKEEERKR